MTMSAEQEVLTIRLARLRDELFRLQTGQVEQVGIEHPHPDAPWATVLSTVTAESDPVKYRHVIEVWIEQTQASIRRVEQEIATLSTAATVSIPHDGTGTLENAE